MCPAYLSLALVSLYLPNDRLPDITTFDQDENCMRWNPLDADAMLRTSDKEQLTKSMYMNFPLLPVTLASRITTNLNMIRMHLPFGRHGAFNW